MARDYKAEYRNYHGTPEQIANRAKRNKARLAMVKKGIVRKGDGMDIDHKKPLSKGGSNAASNLRAVPMSENRSFARTSTGKVK